LKQHLKGPSYDLTKKFKASLLRLADVGLYLRYFPEDVEATSSSGSRRKDSGSFSKGRTRTIFNVADLGESSFR